MAATRKSIATAARKAVTKGSKGAAKVAGVVAKSKVSKAATRTKKAVTKKKVTRRRRRSRR